MSGEVGRLFIVKFQWQAPKEESKQAQSLAQDLKVSPLLARLLLQRGLQTPDEATAFLNPRLEDLHDPYLMRDMERVTERIWQAQAQQEKILIYGDYDVDGITSTVVLKRALEMLGMEADFHIPARLKDGYGLQPEVLRQAKERGFQLAISVDSGIRAFESCRVAKEVGLDLIVTDHHTPEQELPPAYAILNPKRADCPYPYKELAAVGVVFKLVQALFQKAGRGQLVHHFLKLAAIGTVADVVPVTGENRVIVKHGLKGLANPRNVGLQELLCGAGVTGEPDLFDIGFRIAPRINAVTRMGGGREVVDLFWLQDRQQAHKLVEEMNLKNQERRQCETEILNQIEQRVEKRPEEFQKTFLVVAGRDWHRGVIGIVASRVAERFFRPALIVSVSDQGCQGSGRSIPNFSLIEALDAHSEHFVRHGGHAQAVGCSMQLDSIDDPRLADLARSLDEYACKHLSEEDLVPRLDISSYVEPDEVDRGLFDEVQRLAPWGTGNPEPVFASRRIQLAGGPWILKDRHLKFKVQCNGSRLDAIWWKNAAAAAQISPQSRVDLAYTMKNDVYRGREKLMLTVRDIRV